MNKISVKALGQTIEYKGKVILISKELPPNCMVLFVDIETWRKIKDDVETVY